MPDPIYAFPNLHEISRDFYPQQGMTLRDWFAGKAVTGMLSFGETEYRNEKYISKKAYSIADAMLEARNA